MKVLILTHFNNTVGPVISLIAPEDGNIAKSDFEHIPDLMSLYRQGFFIHEFAGWKSANINFEMPSKYARGKAELLMLSLLIKEGDIDIQLVKEYFTKFADGLKDVKGAYKAFYLESDKYKGDLKKYMEIKDLFYGFYNSFPDEVSTFKSEPASIFMFGLHKAGKTTLVRSLQNRKLENISPTISVDVSKIFMDNLSIMVYDSPGQEKYRQLWTPHLKGQDALVFVVDITAQDLLNDAMGVLHDIAMRDETRDLPLLILFNKIDLKKAKTKKLEKRLALDMLGNRPHKYFLTSAVTMQGVPDALFWLSRELEAREK